MTVLAVPAVQAPPGYTPCPTHGCLVAWTPGCLLGLCPGCAIETANGLVALRAIHNKQQGKQNA